MKSRLHSREDERTRWLALMRVNKFDAMRSKGRIALWGRVLASICVTVAFVPLLSSHIVGAAPSPTAASWTVYHGDSLGSGDASTVTAVANRPGWRSPHLDGQLYGEPLATPGAVFVATEDDVVYDLSTVSGKILWSRHLGTPVSSTTLPCGDISPTVGITGTPVIDTSRNEIFVVAEQDFRGSTRHELYGLNTATGAVEISVDVDPPGAIPSNLLQRTGLALDQGHVVFGMGGNDGDCALYRGRVVSVDETSGATLVFTVDARHGESQGAVWMGGAAPVVDQAGDVWVSTGNGSVHVNGQTYDDSDALLELSASMRVVQYFTPTSWASNNLNDLDMSTAPSLVTPGEVVIAGKSRIAYLLNRMHLGGVGHPLALVRNVCTQDVDGGSATSGDVVILPCLSGPVAIRVTTSPASISLKWTSKFGGGPPIIAAGLVWTIGQDGVLYGLSEQTGQLQREFALGSVSNHFPTPGVGDGWLLVPLLNQVVAIRTNTN